MSLLRFSQIFAGAAFATLLVIIAINSIEPGPTRQWYGNKFPTMRECYTEMAQRGAPLKLYKDTSERIVGNWSDGTLFSCTEEESGSMGQYVQGMYEKVTHPEK